MRETWLNSTMFADARMGTLFTGQNESLSFLYDCNSISELRNHHQGHPKINVLRHSTIFSALSINSMGRAHLLHCHWMEARYHSLFVVSYIQRHKSDHLF